ncbi:SAM-dependent methyltransferase [Kribbella sp.]|uniref:SAM-dependent methyltransferase n=1 Tax=Kribbella sp. TaxID=1871183 RepID=UPI002D57BA3E|nr:SAM-dependent methyltransferase [Kribbella sp.]HZX04360.1 SAM-dependent methyltransferase [Kribbella sp.]
MGSERDDDARPAPEEPTLTRVWDALSRGKDNLTPDRHLAERMERLTCMSSLVAANADFRRRTLSRLAGPGQITQFLDCGPGLPNPTSTSTIVHQIASHARILYVDNDPMVLTHTRALLAGSTVDVIEADIFDPKAVLNDDTVRNFFDWSRPVALLHTATLPHCPDDRGPVEVMRGYVDALPPGSYTVISHFAVPEQDSLRELASTAQTAFVDSPIGTGWFRPIDQIAALFPAQTLLEPGLVPCDDWRPTPSTTPDHASIRRCLVGAVGRVQ